MIEKLRKSVLSGAGLLLAVTIGLRGGLEMFYFDSPRRPDPETGRTVPYVMKNVTIYITDNLGNVLHWRHGVLSFRRSCRGQCDYRSVVVLEI